MKKCKFCAEAIQDDAIKCKHCGEWLNKEDSILNKAKVFANKKIEEVKSKKTSHLFIPTEENPLIIDNITFYIDRLKINSLVVYFHNITTLDYKFSQSTLNFVTETNIHFAIEFKEKDISDIKNIILISDSNNGIVSHSVDRKTKEQFAFIYNIISKQTFQKRILKYVSELSEFGYFNYKNKYRFYSNGDLEINGKIRANIKEEYDIDALIWMPSSKGNKNYSFEPYQFIVNNRDVKWYNIFDKSTVIEATVDWDVFLAMFLMFFKTGSFIPPKN